MLKNIFKTVLKDENEADKMLMVEDYPQVWYTDKKIIIFIHKIIANQSRKRFFNSLFCTTTDNEPEGVLNSYIKFSYENKIDHTDRHIRIVYFKAKFYV